MGAIICSLSVLALLAGVHFVVRRRRERAAWWQSSRCTGCGYDLRNGVSDRCPECGRLWWER